MHTRYEDRDQSFSRLLPVPHFHGPTNQTANKRGRQEMCDDFAKFYPPS